MGGGSGHPCMLLGSLYQFRLESGGGEGHYTDEEFAGWRRGKAITFFWKVFDVFCVCAEEVLDILAISHFGLWFDLI